MLLWFIYLDGQFGNSVKLFFIFQFSKQQDKLDIQYSSIAACIVVLHTTTVFLSSLIIISSLIIVVNPSHFLWYRQSFYTIKTKSFQVLILVDFILILGYIILSHCIQRRSHRFSCGGVKSKNCGPFSPKKYLRKRRPT